LEHHPWEKPEVVAVPIVAGSEAYLRWVADSTEPDA
jgi:periplasmic divalent cation tolerance protein